MATRHRKAVRTSRAPRAPTGHGRKRATALPERLPITRARQELCPLVQQLSERDDGVVAVMVGEEVGAYLVSPEKMEQLEEAKRRMLLGPRPSLRGDAELVGDIDEALAAASRLMQEDLDRRWEEVQVLLDGPDVS